MAARSVAFNREVIDMRRLFMLAFLVGLPQIAGGQNCKKGIRCGGSCISASKTCRVGTAAAPTQPPLAPVQGVAASRSTSDSAPALVRTLRQHLYFNVNFQNEPNGETWSGAKLMDVSLDAFQFASGRKTIEMPLARVDYTFSEKNGTLDVLTIVLKKP